MARVTGHIKLVERKSGPVWYLKWRGADGRQVQRRLGPAWTGRGRPPAGHYTERTAREALEAVLTDARRGTREAHRQAGASFADAAAEFLRYVEHVRQREPSTVADYRGVIDGYLLDDQRLRDLGLGPFSSLAIEAITPDHIDAYKEALLDEERLSNRTIVRHLTVLHGIFKRARRVWGLERNPAAADLVERPAVRYSGEFETLRPDEVLALVRAAASPQDGAIYLTAAFTGLRLGELLALRWRDVDFGLQRLQVRRNYTDRREKAPKSGRVRSAPMVDEVMAALDALSRRAEFTGPDELVFPNAVGEHECGWSLRRRYYAALERAGLRRLRFHDLRHCFGTIAAQRLPLPTVQGYMGHAHISTTMRYVHHTPAARDVALLSEAIRAQSAPLSGAVGDTPAPISGHAGDTLPGAAPSDLQQNVATAGKSSEAPTGIEPVYTALQAAA